MLPDELFWNVLRTACFDNDNLPLVSSQIEDYELWLHWDSTGTGNSTLVEPDLFIRFKTLDVIIEAKYDDYGGQYIQQWEKEIIAYRNESGDDKSVYFIAVGGNAEKTIEAVSVSKDVYVNKCTWLPLCVFLFLHRSLYFYNYIIFALQKA